MEVDSGAIRSGGTLAAALSWLLCRRLRPALPPELRGARLAYAESLFRSPGPWSIIARVDRAYRSVAGVLILVELKTRSADCVYPSDVIELSAQRVAVMAETGEAVADQAFVLTEGLDGCPRRYHPVKLLREGTVLALAARRHDLIRGRTKPKLLPSPAICQECAFRRRCYPPSDG